jgi:hypothetical protein
VTGEPGGGCDDPRSIHLHWCGFCGAALAFTAVECAALQVVPPCLRCGERDWRSDVDEMTAPDYRER